MFFSPVIEIALVSIVTSTLTQLIQFKFGNRAQLVEQQKKMKETQKRVSELVGKEDEKSKREKESLESEMLESMNTMMKSSMKSMILSFVVVIPVFAFSSSVYENIVVDLPFPVPWFSTNFNLFNPLGWFELYNQTNWIGWYVLVSLIFSLLIFNPLMNFYKKMKEKK